MAKKEVDPIVQDYLDLKDVVSRVKPLCTNLVFDAEHHEIGYMIGTDMPVDRFIVINFRCGNDTFAGYSIVPESYISFAKQVRKTRSMGLVDTEAGTLSVIGDKEEWEDHHDSPELKFYKIPDMTNVTREYNLLFKDPEITKLAFEAAAVKDGWIPVSAEDLESIRDKNAVTLYTETQNPIIVSKALFGQMKKTEKLQYRVLTETPDTFLVLFSQTEPDFNVYTLVRFLIS